MNLIIKDAVRQILWRLASAVWWFLVIKLITPYLWPLRFGDYTTILKYFAIRSAFADFWLYVIAMKQLGEIKKKIFPDSGTSKEKAHMNQDFRTEELSNQLSTYYHKFVSSRLFMIGIVYTTALLISYLIPSYTSNPYLVRWLPLGMIFSASFMTAGILQIPLQLFWQMKHLSIWLILARVVQLVIIVLWVFWIYSWVDFAWVEPHIMAFNCILISVIASWVTQWLYVYSIWKKHLTLRRNRDRKFTKDLLWSNRQYGLAYYLSSFHTLIVVILISIFYPTTEWFIYAWVYGLALSLIEILLIVPSALGNSLMHDIWNVTKDEKRERFGSLLVLVFLFGCMVIGNFLVFAPHIIHFLWGPDFLTTASNVWSDYVLPFLWIVITLSFIKQVFNYLFVSTDLHNKLLWINLFWVVVWVWIWVPLILQYDIQWGIITQILLEALFVLWALYVAWKHKVIPKITHLPMRWVLASLCWMFIFFFWSRYRLDISVSWRVWLLTALLLNLVLAWVLLPVGKRIMGKL